MPVSTRISAVRRGVVSVVEFGKSFASLVGTDAFPEEVPKVKVEETDIRWQRSKIDRAFKPNMRFGSPPSCLFNARQWAAVTYPPKATPQGDGSELV